MVPTTVFFDIGDTLVRSASWLEGAQACLDALRAQGARLGIISNTKSMNRSELKALLPGDFDFDDFDPALVVLSSEVGLEKPDPRIFLHAVRVSGSQPSECVFVGEVVEETWAAQAIGMRAIRVAHFPLDFKEIMRVLRIEWRATG
ncbi:MAG: HAD-IA family hydrolase [Alphaproteobacteria bacterium]|nr:HAD-IA family hydrolase [Alphaproteobacteria bacterium]